MKTINTYDNKMNAHSLSRRSFLKFASAGVGALTASAAGYSLVRATSGESPPVLDPHISSSIAYPYGRLAAQPPILLVSNEKSNFGRYFAEILSAEGLNCFHMMEALPDKLDELEGYCAVILGEGSYSLPEINLIEAYVRAGGGILAMCPDEKLANLCGVRRRSEVIQDGYLQTDLRSDFATGITSRSIQFHGLAQCYSHDRVDVVAWLGEGSSVEYLYPAISVTYVGKGVAAMWAFDLAQSIVYTRQGNPALAHSKDELRGEKRAADMFVDWIDLERIGIPQADEHQRLFVNVLSNIVGRTQPLPRLWYFPSDADSVLVTTADAHLSPHDAIQRVLKRVENFGGYLSIYYTPLLVGHLGRAARRARSWATDEIPLAGSFLAEEFSAPTPGQVEAWTNRGHEFALHPYVDNGLVRGWSDYWHEYTGRGFDPNIRTTRTHSVLWAGWVDSAKVQASYGIRMNLDYYHWGPLFRSRAGKWVFGYFAGSGHPMRFVDEDGHILEIFQTLTSLADDHMLSLQWEGVAELTPDRAVAVSQSLLNAARSLYPSAITTQFHVDPHAVGGEFAKRSTQFIDGTLSYAAEHGLPILSAEKWLNFTIFRRGIDLSNASWREHDNRLTIELNIPESEDSNAATLMVPARFKDLDLQEIQLAGNPQTSTLRAVGSVHYRCVSIKAGKHQIMASYG